MRSAIVAAALAAGALAVPHKRDVVTDVDVVTATVYQTVWADEAPATSAPAVVVTTTATTKAAHYGHHGHKSSSAVQSPPPAYSSVEVSSQAPASTQAPAPAPSSQAASSQAPAPAPSSSTAPAPSSYAAPSSSAAPVVSSYQAPASYEAPSSSAAPSTPASSASGPAGTGYSDMVLYHHNIHRANHSASDLTWDSDLESWAWETANTCIYAHNRTAGDSNNYGQNIAAGIEGKNISAVITELFYNGEVGWYDDLYNQAMPSLDHFEQWGHFSQIVWSDTTQVACVTKDCTASGLANVGSTVPKYFTVCNYKCAGNVPNGYKNVGDSLGHPTVNWNAGM